MKRPPRKRAKPKASTTPAGDGGGGDGSNDSSNAGASRDAGSVAQQRIVVAPRSQKTLGRYDALLRDVYDGDERALDIIAAAQKRGEKPATKCMGKFYMQKSPTVALRYFEQAAAGGDGDPEAMYMVYVMQKQGIRAPPTAATTASAAAPAAPAAAFICTPSPRTHAPLLPPCPTRLTPSGDGVIKKPDELNVWLKRSADAGYMDAQ